MESKGFGHLKTRLFTIKTPKNVGFGELMVYIPKDPFVCPKGFPLQSYSVDGIETINPTLGRGLDS